MSKNIFCCLAGGTEARYWGNFYHVHKNMRHIRKLDISSGDLSNQNKHGGLRACRQDAAHFNSTFARVSLPVRILQRHPALKVFIEQM